MSEIQSLISLSGADLRKLANGRSARRDDARAEIARRANNRLLNGKQVSAANQAITNRWVDKQDAIATAQVKAQVKARKHLAAQLIDEGAVTWVDDMLVAK